MPVAIDFSFGRAGGKLLRSHVPAVHGGGLQATFRRGMWRCSESRFNATSACGRSRLGATSIFRSRGLACRSEWAARRGDRLRPGRGQSGAGWRLLGCRSPAPRPTHRGGRRGPAGGGRTGPARACPNLPRREPLAKAEEPTGRFASMSRPRSSESAFAEQFPQGEPQIRRAGAWRGHYLVTTAPGESRSAPSANPSTRSLAGAAGALWMPIRKGSHTSRELASLEGIHLCRRVSATGGVRYGGRCDTLLAFGGTATGVRQVVEH